MVQTYIGLIRYLGVIAVFFLLFQTEALAQVQEADRCWVFYRDKHASTFDPQAYFDPKALWRRQREGIAEADSLDFPVCDHYIQTVQEHAKRYIGESRWLNASICYLDAQEQQAVAAFPFVREVRKTNPLPLEICQQSKGDFDIELLRAQTEILGYPLFAANGLNGKGVNIAVFDAGFKGVPVHPQLQHLVNNKQIKATYNIVLDRPFVFDYHNHGTMVLSCMAGIYEDIPMGCAPGANYYLVRTEQTMSESQIEEDHWVRSLEWADKNGADIINSSLGYNSQLYTRQDMSGSSHLMAKAANTAFSKGILVINSAGNDGQDWWEIVAAPGDADSVLTVGGIDPWSGVHHPMSSYGPNTAGQLKPNVSAFFKAVVCTSGGITEAEGTSFSSPLVAGFAACIMQLHPDWTVRQVYQEIQKSAHLYPYFDYAHGYGIPQASYFVSPLKNDSTVRETKTFDLVYEASSNTYRMQRCDDVPQLTPFLSAPSDTTRPFVYYHLCDEQDKIQTYHVILPEDFDGAVIEQSNCDTCLIRAHYNGQTVVTTRRKIREAAENYDEKN